MKLPLKALAVAAVAVALPLAAYLLYAHVLRPHGLPEGLIQANGRIEGDNITVASKYPGRVTELLAREGDRVAAAQILARLDDKAARARLAQAEAAADSMQGQVAANRALLEVLRSEVPNAIARAEAALAAARSGLSQAEAAEAQSERDARRARDLAQQGFVGPQAVEKAELAWTGAHDQRLAATAALRQAEQALRDARLGPGRIRAKQAEVAALRAGEKEAQAKCAEARSVVDDLVIASPAAATVTSRHTNAGEVVDAGTPLFELVDMDRLYLKVFVAEPLIGKLRRDLKARIYSDAFPDEAFSATVGYIASRAEFTPKEVQTPDERVKLVYEVRLYLDANPQHRLTPGQPADAVIRWKEDVEWAKPRW